MQNIWICTVILGIYWVRANEFRSPRWPAQIFDQFEQRFVLINLKNKCNGWSLSFSYFMMKTDKNWSYIN